jgi:hypothetical protein
MPIAWDFSEQDLISNHGYDYGECDGGNDLMSTAYLTRWEGPVTESDEPYVYSSFEQSIYPPQKHIQEVALLPNRSGFLDNDVIKDFVTNFGAVYISMRWNSFYYNPTTYGYYDYGIGNTNHGVAIVGWNDNFDKSNFIVEPPGNGAFIVRNSWGTSWGESGYFYISYYDNAIIPRACFKNAEELNNYDTNYQYDPLGWTSSFGYSSTEAYGANIFASVDNHCLQAVSFYTNDTNVNVTVTIYTGVSGSTNPKNGTLAATKVSSFTYPGYKTVILDSPVALNMGEKFSVVVRFQNSGYSYPIAAEDDIVNYSSGAGANLGESFVSPDGATWLDLGDTYNANVCIKAFTVGCSIPQIALSCTNLNFGATSGSNKTSDQKFLITNSGEGVLDWSISDSASWLSYTPASGTGSANVTVSVNPTGLAVGSYNASIEVTSASAINSPQSIDVNLNVIAYNRDKNPFGRLDTPKDGVTVSANIPVTGWALDDIEVTRIQIKRSAHPDDPPAAIGSDGLIFVGDAVFVKGARPDVEAVYPAYPLADRAGWGYMMLTNMLPNGGNGTFTLHAFAFDGRGHRVELGQKTIYCDNANRTKPFGTLDKPKQGGTASGSSYINWGWALTPQPKYIPEDGSTILVWVDGVPLGHPNYGNYRVDIATKFPGYANSDGAVGYYILDTTQYTNGVHKISWNVRDNLGEADGIGARRFEINNVGGTTAGFDAIKFVEDSSGRLEIDVKGYERGLRSWKLSRAEDFKLRNPLRVGNVVEIELEEVDRLELHLSAHGGNRFIGWGRNPKEPLPECSTLDKEKGIFYWMPEAGFLGRHILHFAITDGKFRSSPIRVIVNIIPKRFNIK